MHTPVFHFLAGFAGRNEVMILKNDGIYDIVRSRENCREKAEKKRSSVALRSRIVM